MLRYDFRMIVPNSIVFTNTGTVYFDYLEFDGYSGEILPNPAEVSVEEFIEISNRMTRNWKRSIKFTPEDVETHAKYIGSSVVDDWYEMSEEC